MKKLLSLALALAFFSATAIAQCGMNEIEVRVEVTTDNFGYETSWTLSEQAGSVLLQGGQGGVYEDSTTYVETTCVTDGSCLIFEIHDTYGDGIFAPFGFELYVDDVLVSSASNNIDDYFLYMANCPPGSSCNNAVVVSEGSYTASGNDHWYSFTPSQNGTYEIEACSNNCDTKIWVYDYCDGLIPVEDNTATIYYDDDQGGCGPQAMLGTLLFEQGLEYWIRIGSDEGDCSGSIDWSLSYNGPIAGCMDPTACNYQPLAMVDNGSCMYFPNPACPEGPDLIVREDVLVNSMHMDDLNVPANDCSVEEGCNNGYGDRDILRFTTHIQNIGLVDYYIGSPGANPDQFDGDNCHNHWHYKGYAEYRLFDMTGQEIPIGFKNGFCVLDLECNMGGTAQYGCSNMGISALCGDIYGSGLACQWIDITDVEPGVYTLVNRTNWDNDPDALGRVETNLQNNWAQACIEIFVNSDGHKDFQFAATCAPYVDCEGELYGSAQYDCNGECNGPALRGDLNIDALQNLVDAQMYVSSILANDLAATQCTDLSDDGAIDVYDAALLVDCYLSHEGVETGAYHEHCNFPHNVTNIFDTVKLSIGAVNYDEQYLDVYIQNPDNYVAAYEFEMSGIEISSVENLIDPAEYPISPNAQLSGTKVIGISYQDSIIDKYPDPTPLVRIHWFSTTAPNICIDNITALVNSYYERTEHQIVSGCIAATGINDLEARSGIRLNAFPNPTSGITTVEVENLYNHRIKMNIVDVTGKAVKDLGQITDRNVTIRTGDMATGIYFVQVHGEAGMLNRTKLVVL